MSLLNIIAYFTESMHKANLFCSRTRTVHSVCVTKATILFMEAGLFNLEIFPNKMTGVKLDGKSIWKIHMDFFFSKILFFLICFNTYEL